MATMRKLFHMLSPVVLLAFILLQIVITPALAAFRGHNITVTNKAGHDLYANLKVHGNTKFFEDQPISESMDEYLWISFD